MSVNEVLADLIDAYPRTKLTQANITAYRTLLADIPSDVLAVAASEIIRTRDFFPTVAEIRRVVAEKMLQIPTGEQALGTVYTAETLNPLVLDTVRDLGGRGAFRRSDRPDMLRRQFLDLYEQKRERLIREAQNTNLLQIEAAVAGDSSRLYPAT